MAKRKWLDDQEQQAWLGLAATMTLLHLALDRQLQSEAGISHVQYGIMAQLSRAPGRTLHMSALAGMTSSSLSRLSHAVATLEAAGWVERSRCEENWRAVHATLTDSGHALVVAAAPGHVAIVRRLIFDRLTRDQVRQLNDITRIALDALAEEGFDTPPWST